MRFENPWAFILLVVIPLILWFYYQKRGRAGLKFSTTARAGKVKPSLRQRLIMVPLWLRLAVLTLVIVALAQPQEGREQIRDISKGIAIEVVVDRSGSMGAEMEYDGQQLTRLEVVKKVFREFVTGEGSSLSGRPNDLIGMISFARFADTIAPLTLAHGAVSQFSRTLKLVTQRSEDGTAIGDAIALAAARLKTSEDTLLKQAQDKEKDYEIKSKIIILITDGQNNAGKRPPLEAANLAKKWGIKVYTIGVGGDEGLIRQSNFLGSFLMRSGNSVDKKTLQTIANTTGGLFRMAEDADALREIYQEIDEMEKSEIESVRYLDYREWFQPFIFFAMALLILELTLSWTVFRKIP